MLVKIFYSYFTLGGLVSLAKRVHRLLSEKFPDHPMIASVLPTLEQNLELAVQSIGSSTKQSLTQTVRDADGRRDNSYRSLRDHVQAGLMRENESYRLACQALWPEFEKNGLKLYKAGDADETAGIDSLLKDLAKPTNLAHLETIHATEWKEELDHDNKVFVSILGERSAVRSTDDTLADQIAFNQLKVSLDLLCNVLNALYAMNDTEGIREAVEEVDQYIREAIAAAKLSEAHAGNGKGQEAAL